MQKILAALGIVLMLPAGAGRAQPQASMAELLASYAEWVAGKRETLDVTTADLDTARRELARLDPSLIPTDPKLTPAQTRELHRRLLTAFALELSAIGAKKQASSAARLVEWACAYIRSHSPLNDYDRAWQLAALSVLEGGIDSRALHDHVEHALPVFGEEPRLMLARAIVEEQFNAPSEVLVRTESAAGLVRAREAITRAEGESFRASERAIARFQEAAKIKEIQAEAVLRGGHVQLRLGRYDAALATWANVDSSMQQEPALLYLLHLFRGIAFEGRARLDEARASYQAALKISPGAHSATMRLLAMGFRYGHGEDPASLADGLLTTSDARRDPWWSYYAADWRFYYPRIARVRELVTTP